MPEPTPVQVAIPIEKKEKSRAKRHESFVKGAMTIDKVTEKSQIHEQSESSKQARMFSFTQETLPKGNQFANLNTKPVSTMNVGLYSQKQDLKKAVDAYVPKKKSKRTSPKRFETQIFPTHQGKLYFNT
jgi:hypothetical protein